MAGEYLTFPIANLLESGSLAINDGYRAKNSELAADGIPFARAGNIDGGFHFEGADRVPPTTLSRVGTKISEPGDVVFTSKGTVGRFAFVRDDTPRFVYSPQLCFWRVLDSDRIFPRWLYYWMNSREFFLQFKGVAGQTDMAEYVSLRDQRAMRLSLPPLPEQKHIAHILGTLDDKIELNRQMNATLECISRAIFKSWFVDFDPVRQKAAGKQPVGMDAQMASLFPDSFEESEIGEVPKGWRVIPLDEVAEFLNGLALQKYPAGDGPTLPVIKISQLRKGDAADADRCSDTVPPEYVVGDGDVLFSWSGSLEVVIWCGGQGALNQHLFKVTSQSFPKWFYYLWTLHHLAGFRLIAADKATTMGHIQRKHLTAAKVVAPPVNCVDGMTRTMAPLLQQSITAKRQSRSLAALRDTLLPKLLSGEVRVSEAEEAVGEVLS